MPEGATTLAGPVTVRCTAPAVEVTANGITTGYATFDEAWRAADAAGKAEIRLLRDAAYSWDDMLFVNRGKELTIDASEGKLTIPGSITVMGDMTLAADSTFDGRISVSFGSLVLEENSLVSSDGGLQGGAIQCERGSVTIGSGAMVVDAANSAVYIDALFGDCLVTVEEGAELAGARYGLYAANDEGGVTVQLNGTQVYGGKAAVCAMGDARRDPIGVNMSIRGGLLASPGNALEVRGADVTVDDGAAVKGAGAAILVTDKVSFGSHSGSLTVGYAEVTGQEGPALLVQGDNTVALSGGTYKGTTNAIQCEDGNTVNGLLAEGCGWFDENDGPLAPAADAATLAGPVTVHGTALVAEVTANGVTTGYATFDEAWTAAGAAGTARIRLLRDAASSSDDMLFVGQGRNITIDARDGELTIPGTLVVMGELTLTARSALCARITVTSGSLVLQENSRVSCEDGERGGGAIQCERGSVTIGSGAVVGNETGSAVYIYALFGDCQVTVEKDAELAGTDYGLYATNDEGSVTVQLDGAQVYGGEAAVCAVGDARWSSIGLDMSIRGGSLVSPGMALEVRGAAVTVDDGTAVQGTKTGILVTDDVYVGTFPGSLTVVYADVTGEEGPALLVQGGNTVALSGGAFEGTPSAIRCEDGNTVNDLLAAGCGWFDENDGPLAPAADAAALEGPVTVRRTAPVAEVTANGTTTRYSSIERAWTAANTADEATVTLLGDVTARQRLLLDAGGRVTFRGGSYTLTAEGGVYLGNASEHTGDTLTVASGVIKGYIVLNGGSVVIDGGTVTGSENTVVSYSGSVTVNSGAVRSDRYSALVIFGQDPNDAITVNGGDIAAAMQGILARGKVTVNGGVITGGENGIDAAAKSDITVTAGAITGGENGICVDGTERSPARLTVNGGTVDGREIGLRIEESCAVTLSGGVFRGGVNAVECIDTNVLGKPIDQPLTVNDLLAEDHVWCDGAGAAITTTADQKVLSGPAKVMAQTGPTATPAVTPTAKPAASPAATPTATAGLTSPATGDGADILTWALMLLGCCAALAAAAGCGYRRGRQGKGRHF